MPVFQVLSECSQLKIVPSNFCHVFGVHCTEENIVLVVVVSTLGPPLDGGPPKTIGVTLLAARLADQSHVRFLQSETPAS